MHLCPVYEHRISHMGNCLVRNSRNVGEICVGAVNALRANVVKLLLLAGIDTGAENDFCAVQKMEFCSKSRDFKALFLLAVAGQRSWYNRPRAFRR